MGNVLSVFIGGNRMQNVYVLDESNGRNIILAVSLENSYDLVGNINVFIPPIFGRNPLFYLNINIVFVGGSTTFQAPRYETVEVDFIRHSDELQGILYLKGTYRLPSPTSTSLSAYLKIYSQKTAT